MIIDQQRLILMNKTTHASKRAHMQEKTKIDQKEDRNSTYVNIETDQSNLKSSLRGSIL